MKWFKHETNAVNDEKMRQLIYEHGLESYGFYMICLEIIAEKIDEKLDAKIEVSLQFLKEKSRLSQRKITEILSVFDQFSLILCKKIVKKSKIFFVLECPSLLKRIDKWTYDKSKKLISNLEVTDKKLTPDKEKEEEQDKEKEIKEKLKQKEKTASAEKAPPRSERFIKPLFEDLKNYCQERKSPVDPQEFLDFYESKNWFVGKNKMRNWQAAVRTWENLRKRRENGLSQQKQERRDFYFNLAEQAEKLDREEKLKAENSERVSQ